MIAKAGKDIPGAFGCLPTARQQLLLRAAAAPLEIARPAWQQWRAGADLDAVDSASRRLLLWIFHRREELGLSPADAAALEPNYRAVWLRNQVLLNRAAEVVRALQAAGIDCLLLKGLPVLLEAYRDEGGRYLEDFDVLVRPDDVLRAMPVLDALGWKSPAPESVSVEKLRAHHFTNSDGFDCDLHWRLLWPPYPEVDETPLWQAKRPIQLRGESTLTLSVEHLLLHLCVHGMSWQPVHPIRWLLDVHLLLRCHNPEWGQVVEEGRRRGVTLALTEALAAYETVFPGEIPAAVREQLARIPATAEQRRTFAQVALGPSVTAIASNVLTEWKLAKLKGTAGSGASGLVAFLRQRWHAQNIWQLPGRLFQRLRLCFKAGYRFFGR